MIEETLVLDEEKVKTIEEIKGRNGFGKVVLNLLGESVWKYWIQGALAEAYQGEDSKKKTIVNASVFGTLGAVEYLVFGESGGYAASYIADWLGVGVKWIFYGAAVFEVIQNANRIRYALKHDKGIISLSLLGLGGSGLFYLGNRVQEENVGSPMFEGLQRTFGLTLEDRF